MDRGHNPPRCQRSGCILHRRYKMEEQANDPSGSTFLDIPTKTGFWTAFIVIVVFMGLAGILYGYAGNTFNQYVAKVGDCFIQGAIISIMFAILKAMIDKVGPFRGT